MNNTVLSVSSLLLLTACQLSSTSEQTSQPPSIPVATSIGDTSQNALDWAGSYTGVLPCSNCEGVVTTLTLTYNNRYQLSQRYLGSAQKTVNQQGKIHWHLNGRDISLLADRESGEQETNMLQFLVGENQLFMLDIEGKRITGKQAENYRLLKEN